MRKAWSGQVVYILNKKKRQKWSSRLKKMTNGAGSKKSFCWRTSLVPSSIQTEMDLGLTDQEITHVSDLLPFHFPEEVCSFLCVCDWWLWPCNKRVRLQAGRSGFCFHPFYTTPTCWGLFVFLSAMLHTNGKLKITGSAENGGGEKAYPPIIKAFSQSVSSITDTRPNQGPFVCTEIKIRS